jgi:hypothetical protein
MRRPLFVCTYFVRNQALYQVIGDVSYDKPRRSRHDTLLFAQLVAIEAAWSRCYEIHLLHAVSMRTTICRRYLV